MNRGDTIFLIDSWDGILGYGYWGFRWAIASLLFLSLVAPLLGYWKQQSLM